MLPALPRVAFDVSVSHQVEVQYNIDFNHDSCLVRKGNVLKSEQFLFAGVEQELGELYFSIQ